MNHLSWLFIFFTSWLSPVEQGQIDSSFENCSTEIVDLEALTICEDDFDGIAEFDLDFLTRSILDSLPDADAVVPTVYINEKQGGLLAVKNLNGLGQANLLCGPFSQTLTDIAVDPLGQIFAVGETNILFRLNPNNCVLTPVGDIGALGYPNSLSFDQAGNLYVGEFGVSTVYRAANNDYNNFNAWHTFSGGSPAGDFVMLGDKMYIAWVNEGALGTNLYEVTVDEDFNYVSHVDLGEIRANTFGLASELGSLYGIAYDELYEISVPDLEIRTVLDHPNPAVLSFDSAAWWGGAGLHEANYEITYHLSEEEASNNQNEISGSNFQNQSNPQILYVRIYDRSADCETIGRVQLEVFENPNLRLASPVEVCLDEPIGGDYTLSELNTRIVDVKENLEITYYTSEIDASLKSNVITEITSSENLQTLYIRAENGSTGCSVIEPLELRFTERPVLSIYGATSVCPFVTGVVYKAESSLPVTDYKWRVTGASSVDFNGDEVVVNWGDTNPDASITFVATYQDGCEPEGFTLPINIGVRLDPIIPQGPSDVCDSQRFGVTYAVPSVPGSQYQWFVENGTIIGQDNLNQVQVDWDANSTGSIYYQEFNPSISQCEGVSDVLTVVTHQILGVQTNVTAPSCIGDSDGTISLSMPDDIEVSEIVWSNGSTGSIITGLSSGNYSYTILDVSGCTIEGTVLVEENPELLVSLIDKSDVTCYGNGDGYIVANSTGGVGLYHYTLTSNGRAWQNNSGRFTGLPPGDYLLKVNDENDCESELQTAIEEPELLEPDLSTLVNDPICPSSTDGLISIMAKGGIGPYTYVWNDAHQTASNTVQGLSKGEYVLNIIDASGCQAEFRVRKSEFYPRLSVPNAFSPNNDGFNDTFSAIVGCTPANFSIKIFNEWGNIIFHTTDATQVWDGTFNGAQVPDGSYAYVVKYSNAINDEVVEEELRGSFKLIR